MLETCLSDRVAQACLTEYAKLGSRGKPKTRSNGVREWTVLAGIVLVDKSRDDHLEVLSLGTGLKCLPADRLPLYGDVLHDSHAEIIAKRGLQLWLYEQLATVKSGNVDASSSYLENAEGSHRMLRLKHHCELAMYVSTLPCGDASMRFLAMTQDPLVSAGYDDDMFTATSELTRGRRGFSIAGALRTKPARADATTTSSLSCSDKLATYSILGIQGALLAYFLQPIYISLFVFGGVPESLRDEVGSECQRALFHRLQGIEVRSPYGCHNASVAFTDHGFCHHKDSITAEASQVSGCPESLSWIQGSGIEVTSQGVKQGAPVKFAKPQLARSRSRLCSSSFLCRWHNLIQNHAVGSDFLEIPGTYRSAKFLSQQYQQAKAQIRDVSDAPFANWLRNSDIHQAFTLDTTDINPKMHS